MVSVVWEAVSDLTGRHIACGGALDEVDLCLSESFDVFSSEVSERCNDRCEHFVC